MLSYADLLTSVVLVIIIVLDSCKYNKLVDRINGLEKLNGGDKNEVEN